MSNLNIDQLNWNKMGDLIPAIIQHAETGQVLMLGYMNRDALNASLNTSEVTFYSRSKQRLWRKGETSGNTMMVKQITTDCDNDSLLIQVIPMGPACHLGYSTCFQPVVETPRIFLDELIKVIAARATSQDPQSYTSELIAAGINRCAQKVGEEAVETVIAAVSNNTAELITETADLLFHLLVLLQVSHVSFYDVLTCLQQRHILKSTK
ncbi:MAG: bifunctional phosphoribosyl-AMP cyclohydrolase/phosphoribosyl-ATP diphosphatase [Legionellales bacterium RIFCSPHIGHO2_12_FULL_42_9]|nr:MAG: bifunctional phosphoribosyl-AMP cyclohydrolase/phosphoribosyl-ATP diphosphatase [Legionellales bacterium RIFCSPHIGHO2_12_FULL_42_9]